MSNTVIHIATLLLIPPLLLGLINKTKSFFAGRVGPPVLQPYYDIHKLMRKSLVLSTTSTWIFIAAPAVSLVTVILTGLLIPLGSFNAPISFNGDLIFFAYLLALGRFFTASAALDTGSAFEGMGASREVTFASLTEPAVFLALLALSKISGTLSLNTILHGPLVVSPLPSAPLVLVSIGLFVVLLAENSRIPVDDPNTHLELTMIHEVMILDHSGPLLGLIFYGAAIKLFIWENLFLHAVIPIQSDSPWLNAIVLALAMAVLSVVVGIIESVMARLQMLHVPYLLLTALLFCGFGFILLVR